MKTLQRWYRRTLLASSTGGLLVANGCLGNFENNLDLVLSPGAFENALRLPYSDLATLATFIARFF